MNLEQVFPYIEKFGLWGVFALMWWLERKERVRLQGILEGYLPAFRESARVIRSVNKVLPGDGNNGDGGG